MAFFPKYRWHKILLPVFISGLMLSCSPLNPFGLASQEYTNIGDLNRLSNQRVVYLKGIVVNVAPFLDGGAYQIQDATGLVWIKTDKPLPAKGASLVVKGELAYQAIFIGQDKLGESYVLEMSQESEGVTNSSQPSSQPPLQLPIQAQRSPFPVNSPIPSPTENTTIEDTSGITSPPHPEETPPPVTFPSPQPSTVDIPVARPTEKPVVQPSPKPSVKPQASPSPKPSVKPQASPSPKPSVKPQASPSPKPSAKPPSKAKFNPDDEFLPHKRLNKEI